MEKEPVANGDKVRKRRRARRPKVSKEVDSEDERLRKRLNAKFKGTKRQENSDGLPCLRVVKSKHAFKLSTSGTGNEMS